MPELITTNFSNRSIDSIAQEVIDLEKHYIDIHMKNPHTRERVKNYGPLTSHLCGSHSEILVAKHTHPDLKNDKYSFRKEKFIDYLGSYHMTLTLPHHNDISTKDFVKMHQHTAQQIYWILYLFQLLLLIPLHLHLLFIMNNSTHLFHLILHHHLHLHHLLQELVDINSNQVLPSREFL